MCRCKACHPGYGFLSENEEFVGLCTDAGLAFLGPTAETMAMFARKHVAREFAEHAGVPVLPGTLALAKFEECLALALISIMRIQAWAGSRQWQYQLISCRVQGPLVAQGLCMHGASFP